MTPRTLSVCFATFSYGGNGGIASECPEVGRWIAKAIITAKKDPRITDVFDFDIADTPITMSRNRAVILARNLSADVLVMVDSDQVPDLLLTQDPLAKPFFESSFNFLYNHFDKGPSVICAPYCGPPPHENCYVFRWASFSSNDPDQHCKIEQYTREEAALLTAITPVAAQPTGLIMFDMRAFKLTEPTSHDPFQVLDDYTTGKLTKMQTIREIRQQSWFYYEYEDCFQTNKASTEDVTATRDISLHGLLHLKYSPIYCNWDAWAGHWKPKLVSKPTVIPIDQIGEKYQKAVLTNRRSCERLKQTNAIELGISTPQKDLDALASLVQNCCQAKPINLLEVGSWIGTSSKAIAKAMGDSILWCVDTWEGSPDLTGIVALHYGSDRLFHLWENNVRDYGYPHRIHPVRGQSTQVAKLWELPLDFIFIDADHSYEAVKADLQAWLKHLKPTGIIAGHDYNVPQFPGVTKAVNEILKEVHHVSTVWWAKPPLTTTT